MIRRLTKDDFASWKAIRLEAVKECPEAYGGSYEEESLLADEEWGKRLEQSPVFAYFEQDRPVAVAGYFFDHGKKNCHRATIFTVYVRKEYRGKRIMDALIKTIESHARDHGAEQLHLGVGVDNTHALECYKRHGFSIYGTDPHSIKIGGTYIDEHLMVKYL